MQYNKSFIDQASSVKMAGYWPHSLFAFLWTSILSRSIKTQKEKVEANIQPSWPRAWSIMYTYKLYQDYSVLWRWKALNTITSRVKSNSKYTRQRSAVATQSFTPVGNLQATDIKFITSAYKQSWHLKQWCYITWRYLLNILEHLLLKNVLWMAFRDHQLFL